MNGYYRALQRTVEKTHRILTAIGLISWQTLYTIVWMNTVIGILNSKNQYYKMIRY